MRLLRALSGEGFFYAKSGYTEKSTLGGGSGNWQDTRQVVIGPVSEAKGRGQGRGNYSDSRCKEKQEQILTAVIIILSDPKSLFLTNSLHLLE